MASVPLISPLDGSDIVSEVKQGAALQVPVIEIDEDEDPARKPPQERQLAQRMKDSTFVKTGHQQSQDIQDLPRGIVSGQHLTNEDGHSAQGHDHVQTDDEDTSSDDDEVHEDGEGEDEDDEEGDIWENGSFLEAALDQLEDSHIPRPDDQVTADECTVSESKAYRRLLRQVGIEEFIRQTLEAQTVSAKKLCSAFGLHIPFLEGQPDEAYYRLLGLAINRELQKRIKLEQWNTIDDAVHLLKEAKNIIVVTGAGISTSLGIPDFRSKDNGLYSRLEHLGLSDPQEVFDIELFREDPTIFYSVAKDILPETKRFTPTHAFIKMLQDQGKLLVNYTQNIDNIEGHAGLDPAKLIQCHGSFATATCQKCGHRVNGDEIHDDIKAGKIPKCSTCVYRSQQFKPIALKRKRSSDHRSKSKQRDFEDSSSDEEFAEEAGIMKPDITFFGENLPDTFHDRLRDTDYSKVDLVIVIGTSMKVAPVAEIPGFVSGQNESIPQIYISRDPCEHIAFDIELLGYCDVVVVELCRRAGWDFKHEMAIPADRKVQVDPYLHKTLSAAAVDPPWQWTVNEELPTAHQDNVTESVGLTPGAMQSSAAFQ